MKLLQLVSSSYSELFTILGVSEGQEGGDPRADSLSVWKVHWAAPTPTHPPGSELSRMDGIRPNECWNMRLYNHTVAGEAHMVQYTRHIHVISVKLSLYWLQKTLYVAVHLHLTTAARLDPHLCSSLSAAWVSPHVQNNHAIFLSLPPSLSFSSPLFYPPSSQTAAVGLRERDGPPRRGRQDRPADRASRPAPWTSDTHLVREDVFHLGAVYVAAGVVAAQVCLPPQGWRRPTHRGRVLWWFTVCIQC